MCELEMAEVAVPVFTEEEYRALLVKEGWSYEETIYFLQLCSRYNLSFVIIADRYDTKYGRTVVDLKERFYEIEARLKASRGEPTTFRYDAEWDRKRRLQLESFHSRPTLEQQEEIYILDEIDRVMRVLPEVIKEREEVMMLYHNGIDRITLSGVQPTMAEVLHGIPTTSVQATPRRKSVSTSASGNNNKNGVASASSARRDRKRSISSAQGSGMASRTPGSAETVSKAASSGPGRRPKPTTFPTLLGSTLLLPIRVGLTRHVDRMLLDYGLPMRPNYATPAVMAKYDEIRQLLAQLADAKKLLESVPPPQ